VYWQHARNIQSESPLAAKNNKKKLDVDLYHESDFTPQPRAAIHIQYDLSIITTRDLAFQAHAAGTGNNGTRLHVSIARNRFALT